MALPPEVEGYLAAFAADRYFEAHEALEGLWWAEDSDPFLQGLILFAAAFVKVQRQSAVGAARHFASALRYLEPYAPTHRGVDVAAVCGAAGEAQARLAAWPAGQGLPAGALGTVVPRFVFRLLPGAAEAWAEPAPRAAPPPALAAVTAAALAARRAAGEPVGPASWAAVVKEVTRRSGGAFAREAVRAAVRRALLPDGRA